MISRIFIDRPIFAWVIAIIIMLGGRRRDPGAADRAISRRRAAAGERSAPPIPAPSAETLQNSVTQVIEQQLTGIDGLLYFTSSSSSRAAR